MNLKPIASLFIASVMIPTSVARSQDDPVRFDSDELSAYQTEDDDDEETKLMKERIRACFRELGPKSERVEAGEVDVIFLVDTQRRLVDALIDFHRDEPKRVYTLLEKNLQLSKQIEDVTAQRTNAGLLRPEDLDQATYFRATAALKLLRYKKEHGFDE